jgi:hypothetical protein
MARYSAAKIIVRYHIGEPNELTFDLAAFAHSASGFFVLCDDSSLSGLSITIANVLFSVKSPVGRGRSLSLQRLPPACRLRARGTCAGERKCLGAGAEERTGGHESRASGYV